MHSSIEAEIPRASHPKQAFSYQCDDTTKLGVREPNAFSCATTECLFSLTAAALEGRRSRPSPLLIPQFSFSSENGQLHQALAFTALSIAAANTSVEAKFVLQLLDCSRFAKINWDDIKYTCSWSHTQDGRTWGNVFIKCYNGSFDSDCICADGINSYGSNLGSRWTFSKDREVTCYTRDGRSAAQVRSEFDSAPNCGSPALYWVFDRC